MFDSSKTITRIAGGIDLLIDVATLGEYGLQEVIDAPATEAGRDRHAVRSHSSFNPLPSRQRRGCDAFGRPDRKVIELDRFLSPVAKDAERPKPGPKVGGHGTTLAPVIPINAAVAVAERSPVSSRVAERQACPEAAPGYTPCTAAARRLALAA